LHGKEKKKTQTQKISTIQYICFSLHTCKICSQYESFFRDVKEAYSVVVISSCTYLSCERSICVYNDNITSPWSCSMYVFVLKKSQQKHHLYVLMF